MELWLAVTLTAAALLTSIISGMLGMAGGITLLGVMTMLLPAPIVVPLHGVVQLASNSTRTLVFFKHIRWSIFGTFALALLPGIALGTWIWSGTKLGWFKPGIGLFILLFLFWRRYKPTLKHLPRWVYLPVGFVSGVLAILVGATGPFLAPFFLRDDFSKEEIVATKAACQWIAHLLKLPAFVSLGFDHSPHLPLLTSLVMAVIVGTLAGKKLLSKISPVVFIRMFEVVLGSIALYLIFKPTWPGDL